MSGETPPPRGSHLLRWGLPRDPAAARHVLGFALTTLVTVVVTRAFLAAAGFPQLGGEGLHIAHVLWGGLAMAVALLLLVSFAGPVIRPLGALLGGIGFGLFIDEIGKFLTDDNDYFYAPAPVLIYVTLVVMVLGADALHRGRPHAPSESLAGAADHAVAGIVGGLSAGARREAERLAALGGGARAGAEVRALVGALAADDEEITDPFRAVAARIGDGVRRVVRAGWSTALTVALLAASLVGSAAALARSWDVAREDDTLWLAVAGVAGVLGSLVLAVRGGLLLRNDRIRAFAWFRRAALLSLLLTEVAVFRYLPTQATIGVAVDLTLLAVVAGERWRLTGGATGGADLTGPAAPEA